MWFGDLVTMRWWDDLWLNESFATYASILAQAEATRFRGSWTTFANAWKTWAYRQDQLPTTHPIAADMVDTDAVHVNFDGITYAKGASVLRQLVAWVGDEAFLRGCANYFRRHEWANTELADFLAALEETSGRELDAWSDRWLETAGVNTMRASFETAARPRRRAAATSRRSRSSRPRTARARRAAPAPHRHRPLPPRRSERLARRQRVELDVDGARTVVAELAGRPVPDLVLVNDDDLAYTKIRLDERLARHRHRAPRPARRPARPLAVLGGHLGHAPRRGARGLSVPRPGARQHRDRDRDQRHHQPAHPGRVRGARVRRPAHRAAGLASGWPTRPGSSCTAAPPRQRPPAGLGARLRQRGARRRAPRPGAGPARRVGRGRRPDDRHRVPLARRRVAGRGGRARRRRDRRRGRARPDRRGPAPRRDAPAPPVPSPRPRPRRGQAIVDPADGPRHVAGPRARLPAARPGGPAGALRRALLRGPRADVARRGARRWRSRFAGTMYPAAVATPEARGRRTDAELASGIDVAPIRRLLLEGKDQVERVLRTVRRRPA